jgi:hypothetical protein
MSESVIRHTADRQGGGLRCAHPPYALPLIEHAKTMDRATGAWHRFSAFNRDFTRIFQ